MTSADTPINPPPQNADPAPSADKAELRRRYLVQRDEAAATAGADAGLQACRQALANIDFPVGAVVSAYWPIRSELDPRPLLSELAARGCRCALPVIVERDAALEFRAWRDGVALVDGPFGTAEPAADAPVVVPDIVIVPLVAFDPVGHRLGYGGGYYDRTLAALRDKSKVVAIGYAYAGQAVEALPVDAFDQRLDWLVTEESVRSYL